MPSSLLKRLFGREPKPAPDAPDMCVVPVWRVIENGYAIHEARHEAGALEIAERCRDQGRRVTVRVIEREMPRAQLAVEFRELLRERSTLRHKL